MPYCDIKTNVKAEKKISKELTKVIERIPGKTENRIMTSTGSTTKSSTYPRRRPAH